MRTYEFEIADTKVVLHGLKGLLLKEFGVLVISDVHLGKTSHFRKHGYPIPNEVRLRDLFNLKVLVDEMKPERVVFLGDLFHSEYNLEWEEIGELMRHYGSMKWDLIPGNHDILDSEMYAQIGMTLLEESHDVGNFLLTHEPGIEKDNGQYVLAGHVHPGVKFKARARNSIVLPCFHFGKQSGLMPSFGSFTGSVPIKVRRKDKVIAVVQEDLHVKI